MADLTGEQRMPNVTTEGIPTSISRDLYLELVRTLGIDPEHLQKLEFRWDVIYAEIRAYDEQGRIMADGDKVAVHRIVIPVDWPDAPCHALQHKPA